MYGVAFRSYKVGLVCAGFLVYGILGYSYAAGWFLLALFFVQQMAGPIHESIRRHTLMNKAAWLFLKIGDTGKRALLPVLPVSELLCAWGI